MHDGACIPPGAELYVRDADAFKLIQSLAAEPATRGAKKRFAEILAIRNAERAAAEAGMAAHPKEPGMYTIFTPGAEIMRTGRAAINTNKGATHV
jgi:hypothetical protein